MISLVTGGAGFIGSHLVEYLLKQGHEVRVIDNQSAIANKNFYWDVRAINLVADICSYESTVHMYKDVDNVFHLAAQSKLPISVEHPEQTMYNNIMGVMTALRCSKEAGVKNFIFMSTSAVYGNSTSASKESDACEPIDPYSKSKHIGEKICNLYSSDINIGIARPFNVFGERESSNHNYSTVLGVFLDQARDNLALTITGNGNKSRDFVYVGDAVRAIYGLSKLRHEADNAYNIGTGHSTSILEVAKMISNNISFVNSRSGEVDSTMADISKIRNAINWEPKTSLNEWLQTVDIVSR